jgi:hypothetical protein
MNTSAEISYEQKVEANRVAPVPPGARSLRTVQWKDAEGRSLTVIVPMGMQVTAIFFFLPNQAAKFASCMTLLRMQVPG